MYGADADVTRIVGRSTDIRSKKDKVCPLEAVTPLPLLSFRLNRAQETATRLRIELAKKFVDQLMLKELRR